MNETTDTVLALVFLVLILLAAIFGHSAVSVAYGQGDPMPILQVEHYLPSITK